MTLTKACPGCGRPAPSNVFRRDAVPVDSCGTYKHPRAALSAPCRPLDLVFCHGCGLIFNAEFDDSLKNPRTSFEETQVHSPRFGAFLREIASALIERYALRNKTILEIGCGSGEFLDLISRLGGNRGIGFDPCFESKQLDADRCDTVDIVAEEFSERFFDIQSDCVICRHLLEHLPDVGEFVGLIGQYCAAVSPSLVFFEVPDARRILQESAFWDLYYEHCSYFTCGSLGRLFRSSGFEILSLRKGFGDQYLLIECRPCHQYSPPAHSLEESPDEVLADIRRFQDTLAQTREAWHEAVGSRVSRGERVVLWGSGAKATAFLAACDLGAAVELVVNINPDLHDRYIAGSGQRIVAPGTLATHRPDLVISLNPLYNSEIEHALTSMGVAAELWSIDTPSDTLAARSARLAAAARCRDGVDQALSTRS